jgi:benzoyl-CoA reductase/2-hydroxyglutaryl-CoA dehydratase subunit BcrC/BadD/HgdB
MIPGGAAGAIRLAEAACADPAQAVSRWKLLTGRKAIGCVPLHTPEEVLHAGGLLPVTIRGSPDRNGGPGEIPADLCPVARGIFHAIRGPLGALLDAIVIPSACDTLQNLSEALRLSGDSRPFFSLTFPVSGSTPGATEDLLDRMEAFREWTEEVGGIPVSEGSLDRSIRAYDENRKWFGLLERRMAECPGYLTAREYDRIASSGQLLPKETHGELLQAILSRAAPTGVRLRGKLFLGGMTPPERLMEALDRAGAALVGNDLAWGHRYYAAPEEEVGDPLLFLVRRHFRRDSCRALPEGECSRAERLLDRVASTGADRLLIVRARRGEPEGGGLSAIERAAREKGVPYLCLDSDLSGMDGDLLGMRIDAFLEKGRSS